MVTVLQVWIQKKWQRQENTCCLYPPSSPCIALFKDGKLVHMIERRHIESNSAQMVADNLIDALDTYC